MTQHEPASRSGLGRAWQEFAAVTATMVDDHDVVGTLTELLAACARAVEADAAGLMLRSDETEQLELLASTSHRAEELELYQLHSDQGPCIDASETGQAVSAYGADAVATTWPRLAEIFAKNGFTGAHASPLRWYGRRLGAIGLFFVHAPETGAGTDPTDTTDTAAGSAASATDAVAQAFADIATLAIVHAGDLSLQQLFAQTQAALAERVVIEQAKGVLAYTNNVSLDAAFDALLVIARRRHRPITQVAAEIVADAAGNA